MRAATEWPHWTERIGVPRPIAWPEVAVFAPLGILSVLLANAESIRSAHDLLGWALVGVVAVTLAALFAAGFSRLPALSGREAHSVPAWVAVLGSLGTGAVFGIGVVVATAALGLSSATPAVARVIGATLFIGWFGVAVRLVLDGRDRIRRERERLLDEMVALEAVRLEATRLADESREAILLHVETTLHRARDAVLARVDAQQARLAAPAWPAIAAELRDTATASVRPLSRELDAAAASLVLRPRPWSFVRYVLDRQPMRPLAVSALFMIGALGPNVQAVGVPLGLTATAISIGVIWAIMLATNAAMARWPSHHAGIYLAGLAVLQSGTFVLRPLSDAFGLPRPGAFEVVASIFVGVLIVFTASAFGALRQMNVEQMAAVAADIDDELVAAIARSRALAQVLRDAASVVHGEVQTRLISCALAIEHAGREADAERLEAALTRARGVLAEPLPALTRATSATLAEEVARKSALWSGLCEVDVDIDPALAATDGVDVAACGRIVEEGIANAVRHGNAARIAVRIRAGEDGIEIVVDDDGSGPAADAIGGLGQAMIAAHSRAWSLTRTDDRTRLLVALR